MGTIQGTFVLCAKPLLLFVKGMRCVLLGSDQKGQGDVPNRILSLCRVEGNPVRIDGLTMCVSRSQSRASSPVGGTSRSTSRSTSDDANANGSVAEVEHYGLAPEHALKVWGVFSHG